MRIRCIAFVLAVLGVSAAMADASSHERIISYRTDITVHEDGMLTVVETIRVHAAGAKIKRGIFRDFVIRYQGPFGLSVLRKPKLVSVFRRASMSTR